MKQEDNELLKTMCTQYNISFEKVEKEIWQYLIPLNMKAGEALVYDHSLLHASGINKTDTPRLVIVYGLIPSAATMRYYFGRDGMIEEYDCKADFYFNETITKGPGSLQLKRKFENNNEVMSIDKLKARYEKGKSFLQKLTNIFN